MKTKQYLGRSPILVAIATTILTVPLFGAPRVSKQLPTKATQAENGDHEMVTRQAVCRWASKPPVLDGKLDDPCWQQAKVIDHFASFWNKTPRAGTSAFLVWDDEAIYYAATMTDAEVRAFGTQRNDTLWEGDVFELFLKPSAERSEYFEFQGNPRGVVFEMAFPKRGQYPKDFNKAPLLGTRAVAVIDGTLDHPGDNDKGWTIEGRIPWTAFELTGAKPKPGDAWLFAICRYDYGPQGSEPVLMSSAPLTQSSFHRYEDYGTLRFEGPEVKKEK
jgi:Carbohydrate family 9 binding domain-like